MPQLYLAFEVGSMRSKLVFLSLFVGTSSCLGACSDSKFTGQQIGQAEKYRPDPTETGPQLPSEELPAIDSRAVSDEKGEASGITPDGQESEGFFDSNKKGSGGDVDTSNRAPRFAMLVNDLKCGMCHTKVHGDVASTSDVNDWSEGHVPLSDEFVSGGWYAAKSWTDQAGAGARYKITVKGGVQQNYVGVMVPNDPLTRKPAFPVVDFVDAESRMRGSVTGVDAAGAAVSINKVFEGNAVVLGTLQNPIKINGSVMIKGDLVLKGYYTGIGSLYVTGNIYVPANLRAQQSVFPFPSDYSAAQQKGRDLVRARRGDALGLATAKNIFIGDLATEIYDHALTPPSQRRNVSDIDGVYAWFPGGRDGYAALYEASLDCQKNESANLKSFNLLEAYLYAASGIGGIARKGSWMINGGIITDVFNVLGTVSSAGGMLGSRGCPGTPSSVHGALQDANYINYDFRMSAGLRILGELAPYFR